MSATGRFARVARIIGAQIAVSLVIAALLYGVKGRTAALSAVIGGAIAFIPAILYASRMVAVAGTDPRRLLRAQYRAEAYKTAGTLALFAATFILYRSVSAPWLFLTYVAALLIYWVALLIDR
ncbi:MAG: ATP synthase subunit I [Burkholderiaceae bacterium]|jgi:ATP synthase protein I